MVYVVYVETITTYIHTGPLATVALAKLNRTLSFLSSLLFPLPSLQLSHRHIVTSSVITSPLPRIWFVIFIAN